MSAPAPTTPRRTLVHEELFWSLRIPRDAQLSPDERHLAHVVLTPGEHHFDPAVHVLALAEDGTTRELATFPGSLPRWAPDGRTLAFCSPGDAERAGIHRFSLETGATEPLLEVADVGSLAWSPDGSHIAFTAAPADERGPLDPIVVREAGFRVNGAGLPARLPQLHVLDVAAGAARRLADLPLGVTSFAWAPDGSRLAFAAGLHLHEPSHAYLVGLDGGAPRRLGPEEGECVTVAWTPDGARLLIAGKPIARSIGHTQLLLRDPDGAAEDRRIAAGLDRDIEISEVLWPGSMPAVTPDGACAIFCATDEGRVHVYRTPLDGDGPAEKILEGETAAYYGVALGRERLATVIGDAQNPGDVLVARFDGSDAQRLTDAHGSKLADAGLVVPQDRWFTAPDGTRVHGFVLRPADAEGPTPLLMDVHGGPHGAWWNSFRDVELYLQEFTARGFTVLLLNPRGSIGYGEEYFRGVTGGWGEHDFQDFMCAVDALVEDGLVDPERMAITGYSYGGFTTNNIIGRTDRFAAAVSFAGITDFVGMFAAAAPGTGLIQMELGGPPAPDRWELYDHLSPLRRADKITTPVLFMHPLDDQTAPPSQSEALFTTLKALGKVETELVLYPGTHHLGSTWPFPPRLDSWRRTLDWILDHLGMEDVA